jgi:hypothetical protein
MGASEAPPVGPVRLHGTSVLFPRLAPFRNTWLICCFHVCRREVMDGYCSCRWCWRHNGCHRQPILSGRRCRLGRTGISSDRPRRNRWDVVFCHRCVDKGQNHSGAGGGAYCRCDQRDRERVAKTRPAACVAPFRIEISGQTHHRLQSRGRWARDALFLFVTVVVAPEMRFLFEKQFLKLRTLRRIGSDLEHFPEMVDVLPYNKTLHNILRGLAHPRLVLALDQCIFAPFR